MILNKRFFLTFTLVLATCIFFAQLNGNAQLASQSNHAGIKVKFKANPGTAVTDSTLTDAVGNYSINITGGNYNVILSKTGYQSIYYNNNQPVILTNTTGLNSVTLIPGNMVNVTGTVSGNWVNSNIYVVNGDITIPTGSTLNIQPGTGIRFNGNYSITAYGALKAIGNLTSKILFTSNLSGPNPGDWNGVFLYSSQSILDHCIIEYHIRGIQIASASPNITNNEIRKFTGYGVYFNNSSSIISGNEIHDYRAGFSSQGITGDGTGTTVIQCNYIHDGGGYGIRPYGNNVIVRDNKIEYIDDPTRGNGIDASWGSPKVINNVISNCITGIKVAQSINPSPSPLLLNNTIFSNTFGISLYDFYASPSIIGNLITNNLKGIVQSTPSCAPLCSTTPSVVSYNNVWNNINGDYDGVEILGLGQMVSQNGNGDPVDSYFNISKDPMYDASVPPFYLAQSPCVNAGHPSYHPNIGASITNSCSILAGVVEHNAISFVTVFPNPFYDRITVNTGEKTVLRLYDIIGRNIEINSRRISGDQTMIVTNDFVSGIYFLEIINNNSKQTIKLIKQ